MIHIGTSGFNYKHWGNGVFYPAGLPQREWLEYYARHFKTVELNVTFYRLPTEEAFKSWEKRTPKDFAFAIKGSRFITHVKRLGNTTEPLELFFERASNLGKKLVCVLWQLPPSMHADLKRLEGFLKLLKKFKTRHAFEFRHISWWDDKVFELLKENYCSFCHADFLDVPVEKIPKDMPYFYFRFHGTGAQKYSGNYPRSSLRKFAKLIKERSKNGREVFVYFNNDAEGFAVKNAMDLSHLCMSP